MRYTLSFLIAVTVSFCSPEFIFAGDVAPPVPTTPQQIEVSHAQAPITMMVEDAQKLIQQMKNSSVPVQPLQSQPSAAVSSAASARSTIKLDVPAVVNNTPYFKFRDITDRSANSPSVINKR